MSEAKYVVFILAKERYGLPIESVEQILPMQEITRLPKTPKMLLGVVEVRGTTIPVVDARKRFEIDDFEDSKNLVVVTTEGSRCALRVDQVDGIITLEEEEIDSNPSLLDMKGDDFVSAIGKQDEVLTVLLNPEKIVPDDLKSKVQAAA